MSKTVESNSSNALACCSYAEISSDFLSFAFERYSFERSKFADSTNSGKLDTGSPNCFKSN